MKYLLMSILNIALIACSDSSNTTSPDLVSFSDAPGPFNVGQKIDILIRDNVRDRDVTVTLWYPTNGKSADPENTIEGASLVSGGQRLPLVVLIHGIEDDATATWPYLAPHLASHGYVVAAPSLGSSFANREDLVNHPGDVSFLIDVILGDVPGESMFLGRIDEQKVAVGGYSFGGAATYLLVYDPIYKDSRIRSAILMAGLGGESPPINPDISLLTVFGTEDILVPYSAGLNIYEAANPTKYLVTLEGGGHVGFTSSNETNIGASMDQKRQQALVRLSVFAYLTSVFDSDATNRLAAQDFLRNRLAEENTDVLVYSELQ